MHIQYNTTANKDLENIENKVTRTKMTKNYTEGPALQLVIETSIMKIQGPKCHAGETVVPEWMRRD
jgi:ribosomal protein L21E